MAHNLTLFPAAGGCFHLRGKLVNIVQYLAAKKLESKEFAETKPELKEYEFSTSTL